MPNRILPALVTPLTAAGQLDVPSAERLINHLYERSVGGLYVTGSTGEGIYLDFAVRQKIVELAVGMSRGRGRVMAAEIMICTPAIRALIRDDKVHQIVSSMQGGKKRKVSLTTDPVISAKPGWRRGDFHTHTGHSDGACAGGSGTRRCTAAGSRRPPRRRSPPPPASSATRTPPGRSSAGCSTTRSII